MEIYKVYEVLEDGEHPATQPVSGPEAYSDYTVAKKVAAKYSAKFGALTVVLGIYVSIEPKTELTDFKNFKVEEYVK